METSSEDPFCRILSYTKLCVGYELLITARGLLILTFMMSSFGLIAGFRREEKGVEKNKEERDQRNQRDERQSPQVRVQREENDRSPRDPILQGVFRRIRFNTSMSMLQCPNLFYSSSGLREIPIGARATQGKG